MAFDSPDRNDIAAETDEVIGSFGMSPTRNNLFCMAEEMERRLRFYPGGRLRAWRIVAELTRRAIACPLGAK